MSPGAPKKKLHPATAEDAEAIASLRNAISDQLTFSHGKGPWTVHATTAEVLSDLRTAKLYVMLRRDEVIASLKLSAKTPWPSAGLDSLSSAKKPLYLTALAVAPQYQGRGYGRASLDEATRLARRAKADAIIVGTPDHPKVKPGAFFITCGFREIGQGTHRATVTRFYELSL